MSVERHHAQEENVGAYLLSALTEIETRAFEKHLEECPVCQDELDRLRPAVDALPRSVDPVSPPASLKTSLMATVNADAREARGEARSEARRHGMARRLRERISRLSGGLTDMRPGVAWMAASIVLLAGMVGGATGLYAISELTSGDNGARTVTAGVDKTRVPQASGSFAVAGNSAQGGVLRVHGLPTLENDSVYQVWLRRDGEAISQSLFSVGEDGDGAAAVADDLKSADAVMVTRERAGGAKAPSEKPVLNVRL